MSQQTASATVAIVAITCRCGRSWQAELICTDVRCECGHVCLRKEAATTLIIDDECAVTVQRNKIVSDAAQAAQLMNAWRWHKTVNIDAVKSAARALARLGIVAVVDVCALCKRRFIRFVRRQDRKRIRYCSLRCARAAAMLRYAERIKDKARKERSANDGSLSERE